MKIFLKSSQWWRQLSSAPHSLIIADQTAAITSSSFLPHHYLLNCKYESVRQISQQKKNLWNSPMIPEKNTDLEARAENKEIVNEIRVSIDKLFEEIRAELSVWKSAREIAVYNFDGKGKSLRPLIVLLMAKAINAHQGKGSTIHESQIELAKIIEMIHTSSLLHDDVVDGANTRRGKPAVHSLFSHKKAIFVGDFILSVAASMLARIDNHQVTKLISQILVNLVQGEFMQLSTMEEEEEMFSHYLSKTYNKTASLIAISCRAVAVLAGANEEIQETCFQYGKNCGIAFQLIDDMLDFTCTINSLGKPNLNDLNSGLATAPVLFACEKFPELYSMIKRHFQDPEDVKRALSYVQESDGLEKTKLLAFQHCQKAIAQINILKPSPEQKSLVLLTDDIIHRVK